MFYILQNIHIYLVEHRSLTLFISIGNYSVDSYPLLMLRSSVSLSATIGVMNVYGEKLISSISISKKIRPLSFDQVRDYLKMMYCKFELFWPPPLCHTLYYALCTCIAQSRTPFPLLAWHHLWMFPFTQIILYRTMDLSHRQIEIHFYSN